MLLPTTDVPEMLVKDKLEALSESVSVLATAPKEPPVPMASVLPALTVVVPAKAVLLPVKVKTPVPACIKFPEPVMTEALEYASARSKVN